MKFLNGAKAVFVIVPLRKSTAYVSILLGYLLNLIYPHYLILLAGEPNDPTWAMVPNHPRVRIVTTEVPKTHKGRTSNIHRKAGTHWALRMTRALNILDREDVLEGLSFLEAIEYIEANDLMGPENPRQGYEFDYFNSVFFFTDAKIQQAPNWITQALEIMARENVQSVAGIMVGTVQSLNTFFGLQAEKSFVKRNPEFGKGRILNYRSSGTTESSPITACWAFSAVVFYRYGDFIEEFNVSYEDISFATKICMQGGSIYCTSEWQVLHEHRTDFRSVLTEYIRSGRGAGQHLLWFPTYPFSIRRAVSVAAVLLAMLTTVITLLFLIISQAWVWTAFFTIIGILGYTMLGILNARRAEDWRGFFFPFFTIFFIVVFSLGFVYQLYEGKGGASSNRHLQTVWSM